MNGMDPVYVEHMNGIYQKIAAKDFNSAFLLISQAVVAYGNSPELSSLSLLLNPKWDEVYVGKRVRIRPVCESDAEYLHRSFSNHEFMDHFHPTVSRQRSVKSIAALIAEKNQMFRKRSQYWVVERLQTNDSVGILVVADLVAIHRRAELLVGMPDEATHGSGLAAEAVILLLNMCFNLIGLNKLTSMVLADNPHSQKSTLSIGFRNEGIRRSHIWIASRKKFCDCYENGMTSSDFHQNFFLRRLEKRWMPFFLV